MRNHIANICHENCLPLFNHFCLVIPQHLTLQQKKRAFNEDKTVTYDWLLVLKAGSFPFSEDFVAQHRSQLQLRCLSFAELQDCTM